MTRHVSAVGMAVAKRHVHHGARQRAVGAGTQRQVHVGLLRRAGAIGVDHHQPGPARLPRPGDMGHHVDLRVHRVAAPHHDEAGSGHLARIGAGPAPDAGDPAGLAHRRADGRLLAGIAHDMPQPVDAVALHEAHGAGEIIWPHRGRAMRDCGVGERCGDAVERLIPANSSKIPAALGAGAQQRMGQPVRVMDAIGVAGDLRADHPLGIGVGAGAAHGADALPVDHLHLERAGRWTVMRTDGRQGCGGHGDAGTFPMTTA
jgi:hypothetical protein